MTTKALHIRGPYTTRIRSGVIYDDPVTTKQSFKDECDINKIMARYVKTGVVEHINNHAPNYGFATANDFRESLELIAQARSTFADLPAEIRKKFDNDPSNFLGFVEDPNNRSELALMGLLNDEATAEEAALVAAAAEPPVPPHPAEPPTPE